MPYSVRVGMLVRGLVRSRGDRLLADVRVHFVAHVFVAARYPRRPCLLGRRRVVLACGMRDGEVPEQIPPVPSRGHGESPCIPQRQQRNAGEAKG
jgi:hypothetical protein